MSTAVRLIAGTFLAWHGLVHIVMWRFYESTSWDPRSSWLVADGRALTITIAALAAALFVLAGLALLADQDWWAFPAVAASLISITLMLLTFNVRWLWGIALDAGVIAVALRDLAK